MTTPGGETFRIPCPAGHVHVAREAWLGREMICPECNAAFVIRKTDSLEHAERLRRREEDAEDRRARAWLTRAIVTGVLVLLSLVGMMVASLNPQWFERRG